MAPARDVPPTRGSAQESRLCDHVHAPGAYCAPSRPEVLALSGCGSRSDAVLSTADMIVTENRPESDRRAQRPRALWKRVKKVLTVAIAVLAVLGAYQHRAEISQAAGLLSHLRLTWLLVAIVAELGSMVVFARLQRWLLRAGGVQVPVVAMVEVTLAGNALSTSLPGGAAWSATWVYQQLRRRGADKVLAGWVILVAGPCRALPSS